MKVAVCSTRGNGGSGVIEVYDVPEEYFVEKYAEIDPHTLVEWVREVGILLYKDSIDYLMVVRWSN